MPQGHYNTGYKQQFVEKSYRIPEVDLIPYPWSIKFVINSVLLGLIRQLIHFIDWFGARHWFPGLLRHLLEAGGLADNGLFPINGVAPVVCGLAVLGFLDQWLRHLPLAFVRFGLQVVEHVRLRVVVGEGRVQVARFLAAEGAGVQVLLGGCLHLGRALLGSHAFWS